MGKKGSSGTLFATLIVVTAAVSLSVTAELAVGQSMPPITIDHSVPVELNPPFVAGPPSSGGAPAATPAQASAFAWQEFIALNWPVGPQKGRPNEREKPAKNCRFGDPSPTCGLLVWETFRGKVEIFPGDGNPPAGYTGSIAENSWGYDALPAYHYAATIPACDSKATNDPTPWVNLDETDQIKLDNMYAGVVEPDSSPGNVAPQLIRFLAKANRVQYVYVTGNSDNTDQWWSEIPKKVADATNEYLTKNMQSPPAGSKTLVSLPFGAIEAKAGWRPLNASEIASGRFHTQTVRFYEGDASSPCYRDATWGLVALHIIQKTPSAPYFIYATFEQADNILAADGKRVEDEDGNIVQQLEPATATTPQVCLIDPQPPTISPPPNPDVTSTLGSVILTADPTTCQPSETANYCGAPGSQLYYRNENNRYQPAMGNICVNKRDNAIPDYVIAANKQAHASIRDYLRQNKIDSAPWLSYKLINIQYYPYDKVPDPKIPNGSPYTTDPPYSAGNPAPSSYYQANIVVETNRSLQLFTGGLSLRGSGISTEWNISGQPHKNMYYNGKSENMGGCMGCHGSQGQMSFGDFSVILARGAVVLPEVPALATSKGMTSVFRNR